MIQVITLLSVFTMVRGHDCERMEGIMYTVPPAAAATTNINVDMGCVIVLRGEQPELHAGCEEMNREVVTPPHCIAETATEVCS